MSLITVVMGNQWQQQAAPQKYIVSFAGVHKQAVQEFFFFFFFFC